MATDLHRPPLRGMLIGLGHLATCAALFAAQARVGATIVRFNDGEELDWYAGFGPGVDTSDIITFTLMLGVVPAVVIGALLGALGGGLRRSHVYARLAVLGAIGAIATGGLLFAIAPVVIVKYGVLSALAWSAMLAHWTSDASLTAASDRELALAAARP